MGITGIDITGSHTTNYHMHVVHCQLHTAAPDLLAACEAALAREDASRVIKQSLWYRHTDPVGYARLVKSRGCDDLAYRDTLAAAIAKARGGK